MIYKMTSVKDPTKSVQKSFVLKTKLSTCSLNWLYPQDPFSFDRSYNIGDPTETITFDSVSINDCPFELLVTDITDPANPVQPHTDIFTLIQPVLTADLSDSRQYSVSSYGKLEISIDALKSHLKGIYNLRLDIIAKRHPAETSKESLTFTVTVTDTNCVSVSQDQETTVSGLSYTLGDP